MRGCDLETLASGRIEVDCGWVVGRCAKVVGSPDYVQAHLGGTHPVGVQLLVVHESLAIAVVLLLAKAEGGERDAFVWQRRKVVYPASRVGGKAEVTENDGQHRRVIAPIRVIDGVKGVVVVGAPFQLL